MDDHSYQRRCWWWLEGRIILELTLIPLFFFHNTEGFQEVLDEAWEESVVVVEEPAPAPPPLPEPTPDPPAVAQSVDWDRISACIRDIESGGDYTAINPSGKYRGAYQFDIATWESVGGVGDPAQASPAEQDHRAYILWSERGLSPWPTPSKRC